MKRSQLAINSVSTRGGFEESLAAYQRAGFVNVEFILGPVKDWIADGRTPAQARRLLEAHGLKCIGGFDCGLEAFAPESKQEQNRARLVENARLLHELGGANLVVGTDGPSETHGDPLGVLAARFGEIAGEIEPLGVSLLIEFNWSPLVKSLRAAVEVAKRSGAVNVGVLFDPAHYHCTPTKFEQISAASVPFIRHVHVNDMADKAGELCDCNGDRVLPGAGCLDLGALFGRLEEFGYDGYFSIEMFSDELWEMPVEVAARRMIESLLPLCEGAS